MGSLEAGEVPSKTNSGSYANGNPYGRCDGTHYKETLAKQWARIVVTEINTKVTEIAQYLRPEVKAAITSGNWSPVYPEIAKDIQRGANSYYRNQIEKLLQMGVLIMDEEGYFHPKTEMYTKEFIKALCMMWNICEEQIAGYDNCALTREAMGGIILDAYALKFGRDAECEWIRPRYMTDYNGTNLIPTDPNYDPNLIGESAQYYPMTGWERITDTSLIANEYYAKVCEAYKLGLIRCEDGIHRGVLENGTKLEPKEKVTREKAAKALYFLWILPHDIMEENHRF